MVIRLFLLRQPVFLSVALLLGGHRWGRPRLVSGNPSGDFGDRKFSAASGFGRMGAAAPTR
jgi:20S proteasome alpha/beta subunit